MTYYKLLDRKDTEVKPLNENCTCSGYTLLHYGCKCDCRKKEDKITTVDTLEDFVNRLGVTLVKSKKN